MKKKITLTLLCLCLLLPAMSINAAAANDDVRDAMKGVARVVVTEGGYVRGHGTAFAVSHHGGSTYFVTNLHCVDANPDGIYIILDDLTTGNEVHATVYTISEDPDLDLVILETRQLNNYKALTLAHSNNVQIGDRAYALGFPGVSDDLNDDDNLPSRIGDVTLTGGIIGKLNFMAQGYKSYQSDVAIAGGNSGGPLVNERGAVIGVNTFGHINNDNYSYSLYIDYIIDALEASNIPYAKFDPSASPSNPNDPGQPSQGTASDGNGGVVILIVVGVILVIVVVIIVAANASKKKPAQASAAAGVLPRPPVQGGVMPVQQGQPVPQQLCCTCGQFAGAKFPIGGKIALGRDPARCQIVFDGGAQGISSLHCEIVRTPSGILLIDKGSTYGTYLKSNGRKLNAGESIPLRSGDAFYLADTKNEFFVQ